VGQVGVGTVVKRASVRYKSFSVSSSPSLGFDPCEHCRIGKMYFLTTPGSHGQGIIYTHFGARYRVYNTTLGISGACLCSQPIILSNEVRCLWERHISPELKPDVIGRTRSAIAYTVDIWSKDMSVNFLQDSADLCLTYKMCTDRHWDD